MQCVLHRLVFLSISGTQYIEYCNLITELVYLVTPNSKLLKYIINVCMKNDRAYVNNFDNIESCLKSVVCDRKYFNFKGVF